MKASLLAVFAIALALLAVPAGEGSQGQVAFRGTISRIDAAQAKRMTGVSWRPGCPVHLRDLRLLRLTHRRFDGKVATGRLIVHRDVARDVVSVFRRLYAARVPIRRMVPVDAYGASDFRSIEADNTSAFNCRYVEGTSRWSEHAYGRAIDFNPIENPYVSGGRTSHRRASRISIAAGAAPEWLSRAAPSCVRSMRSAGAGEAAGRPSRTTSTSPRAAARSPAARPPAPVPKRGSGAGGGVRRSSHAQIAPPRIPPASGPTM